MLWTRRLKYVVLTLRDNVRLHVVKSQQSAHGSRALAPWQHPWTVAATALRLADVG